MKQFKNYIKSNYLAIVIILIETFMISISFGLFKNGYHSDEMFAYGFSNSFESKEIFVDDDGNSLSNQWHDSTDLFDYITVDKNHRFSFSVPYKHSQKDLNPPFHLLILHAICSFFPGVYSKWFAFSINIFSFFVIQIVLYLLFLNITENKYISLAPVLCYGLGAGCMDTIVFLRMYALGTALAVLFIYFVYEFYRSDNKKNTVWYLIFSALMLFLGSFTLHLYLVFAFPVCVVFCVFLLIKKSYKKLIAFFVSELSVAASTMLLFSNNVSYSLGKVENLSYTADKYSDAFQFRIYSYLLTRDVLGFHFDMYSNPWIKISLILLLFIVLLIIPFGFVFRKEIWLKQSIDKILLFFKTLYNNADASLSVFISSVCTIVFTLIIVSKRTSVYSMGLSYSSRYIFLIYPFLIILVFCLLYYVLVSLLKKNTIVIILTIVFALVFAFTSHYYSNHSFLFYNHPIEGISMDKLEDDSNCVVFLTGNWQIVIFCTQLYHTGQYYFADFGNYTSDENLFSDLDKTKPTYLLIDVSSLKTEADEEMLADDDCDPMIIASKRDALTEKEVLDYYASLYPVKTIELVGSDFNYAGVINIYRVDF